MGLALVVDQLTQLPLAHVLYEGARSDRKTFAEFLKPVQKHLLQLTGQPDQLTLVFDAGSSSRQNLEDMKHYVTAVRPSSHLALLQQAAGELSEVQLASGAKARAWRTTRVIAGKRREVVVVFSSKLHAGQLRGLHQTLSKCWREFEERGSFARTNAETAKRKLEKLRKRQYLRSLFCYRIDQDGTGPMRVSLWSDWLEYQRLNKSYFGLRVLITDRAEWTTAQIIEAYRGRVEGGGGVSRSERSPHALHPASVSLDRSKAARSRFHLCDGLSAHHSAAPTRPTESQLRWQSTSLACGIGRSALLPLN